MSKFGTRSFSLFFRCPDCTLKCTILWWRSLEKKKNTFFYAEMMMRNHWKLTLSNTVRSPKWKDKPFQRQRVCFKHTHIIFRQWKSTLVDGNSGTLLLCQTDALAALNCSLLCPWQNSLDGKRERKKTNIAVIRLWLGKGRKNQKVSADTHPADVCQGWLSCSHFTYFCCFCCFSQQSVMEKKSCFHKWPIKNV